MPGGGFSGMPGAFGEMPGIGGKTRSFHYSTDGGGGGGLGGGFSFTSAQSIFEDFMRQQGGSGDDLFAQFGGNGGGGGRSRYRESGGGRRRPPTPEATIVEKPLPLSLEELFSGRQKKMRIQRKTYEETSGKRKLEDKLLNIEIKPGYKAGTKIKFKGVGDQEEGGTQDLHFIIKEKDHTDFKREDDNLRTYVELDLKEALTGWTRTLPTIDGKQFTLTKAGPTGPGYTEVYPDRGMPKSKKPSERGDMIVEHLVPADPEIHRRNPLARVLDRHRPVLRHDPCEFALQPAAAEHRLRLVGPDRRRPYRGAQHRFGVVQQEDVRRVVHADAKRKRHDGPERREVARRHNRNSVIVINMDVRRRCGPF
ncbi:MAG: hypothetical protein Q9214_007231 [Letrouitia sp. 1 TL-2023]